jgi:hypothetical protein
MFSSGSCVTAPAGVDEALRSGRSSTGSWPFAASGVSSSARSLRSRHRSRRLGLLLASLNAHRHVDLRFDTHNVISVGPAPAACRGPGPSDVLGELERRVAALPGVTGVAFADGRPPSGVGNINNFDLEAHPTPAGESQPATPWVAISPDYVRVLGLRLLQGRLLDARDAEAANLESVVVDRAWANRFFPNGTPWASASAKAVAPVPWIRGRHRERSEIRRARQTRRGHDLRSALAAIAGAVPARAHRIRCDGARAGGAADVARARSRSCAHRRGDDRRARRHLARTAAVAVRPLVAAFAIVALALSIVGIYGVMTYYVQQHSKDISIRLALGGSHGTVLGLILGQGMKVVAGGVVIGIGAALMLTRLLSSLLFEVGAADAPTYVFVSLLLLVVALIACALPARRAVGLQPAVVLRNE